MSVAIERFKMITSTLRILLLIIYTLRTVNTEYIHELQCDLLVKNTTVFTSPCKTYVQTDSDPERIPKEITRIFCDDKCGNVKEIQKKQKCSFNYRCRQLKTNLEVYYEAKKTTMIIQVETGCVCVENPSVTPPKPQLNN